MIPKDIVNKEALKNSRGLELTFCYNPNEKLQKGFTDGVKFAEKYIKEFAEWIGKNQYNYFNPPGATASWFDSEDRSMDCNTEELFKMFLDEKSKGT